VRFKRLCFQTSRAPAQCVGAPQAPVRPQRRCAPSAPRARTPRGVVRRSALSASAPQAPVRPDRPARRCVWGLQAPVRRCGVRPEIPRAFPLAPSRPPPCAAAPVRPACCFHCALRVRVPPSADASFPALPSAPPRIKVRPCAPGNRAPRAPVHPCARCTDALVLPCAWYTGAPVRLLYRCARALREGDGEGAIAAPSLAVLGLCAISPPLLWRCRCGRCARSTTPPSAPPSSSRCSADTSRWRMGVDAAPAAAPAPPRRTAPGHCPNQERLPISPTAPTGAGVTDTTQKTRGAGYVLPPPVPRLLGRRDGHRWRPPLSAHRACHPRICRWRGGWRIQMPPNAPHLLRAGRRGGAGAPGRSQQVH